jgi:hypothetical protein
MLQGVFYLVSTFKGERLKDNYIKLWKIGICMAMQKNNNDYFPI